MGKHSEVSSFSEWRLGKNVVLRPMECLTPTAKFDIFITILHLFVSQPTLEFTTFEQQVCSTTKMYHNLEQTASKKWNMATLNSAHQTKKQCNFDSG